MKQAGAGFVLVVSLLVSGCATSALEDLALESLVRQGPVGQEQDPSGMTKSEATGMTLEEQYRLAGERYAKLNELMAGLQSEFATDEWIDGTTFSPVVPRQGYVTRGLGSDDQGESYYFSISRWYAVSGVERLTMMRSAEQRWKDRGWNVVVETFLNGDICVVATTPEGFWISLDEDGDRMWLMTDTPVYWGEQRELSTAIAARRDAEHAAGATWETADRDENREAFRLPGVFQPFPAWDAVPFERPESGLP